MKKTLLVFASAIALSFNGTAQLYDQTAGITTSGVISANLTDLDTLVQSADDFTIPAGADWVVTSVTVHGFRNSVGANMTQALVEIYDDASGPGTAIYSDVVTLGGAGVPGPVNDTAVTITIPTQTLSPGTYWLSVAGYTESTSRWNWTTHGPTQIGATSMLIDVDDMFGAGATDWTSVLALGLTDPDFTFQINGTGGNVGITELNSDAVSVYPNPAVDVITIATDATLEAVKIMNVDGKVVLTETNPSNVINVANFPAGVYVMEVSTEAGVAMKRFVKK